MKIIIPRNAVALAIDYKGDAQHITAVRLYPEEHRIIPQFQLNANPVSKDFGCWRQIGLYRNSVNAETFIAKKTRTAARLWVITPDKRFVDIWERGQGAVDAADVQLAPVKEAKDDKTA